jgi:glycosyltransferase involved in cell wall biosynthesis
VNHLAVVIPACDCAQTIGAVVAGARPFGETVVVVDDGSADQTAAEAKRAGAVVLTHASNRGKGAALATGMQWAASRGFDHVVTIDGDGEHLGREIGKLVERSAELPDALVIGARKSRSTAATPMRQFGNRFANRWVTIACGAVLPDTQSGFRLYPLQKTLALGVRARHFAFETEVLIRAVRARIDIESVDVDVCYRAPHERTSHYRNFADTVRIIFVVLGLIFRVW